MDDLSIFNTCLTRLSPLWTSLHKWGELGVGTFFQKPLITAQAAGIISGGRPVGHPYAHLYVMTIRLSTNGSRRDTAVPCPQPSSTTTHLPLRKSVPPSAMFGGDVAPATEGVNNVFHILRKVDLLIQKSHPDAII
jgi:hypothetical protein